MGIGRFNHTMEILISRQRQVGQHERSSRNHWKARFRCGLSVAKLATTPFSPYGVLTAARPADSRTQESRRSAPTSNRAVSTPPSSRPVRPASMAKFERCRPSRTKQREVALDACALPEFASHRARIEEDTPVRAPRFHKPRAAQLAAAIAMNLHGPNRHHPLGIEVAPGAYAVEKLNISRADGINARVPALRATGRLALHQGNPQPGIACAN